MGAGYHGGFGKTRGSKPVPGDAVFKSKDYTYFNYIKKRKDKVIGGVSVRFFRSLPKLKRILCTRNKYY